MGVVGPCVPGASQVDRSGCHGLGGCIGRPAAPVTVSNGGGSLLPVSGQDAPGVPGADPHERGCLVQGHVFGQQAVQDLKSGLFFGSQRHILHRGNVTFMLAS